MIIGIPKELKDKETRVGLIPKWVFRLTEQGHTVYIQKGLAEPAGIADEEYINVGAKSWRQWKMYITHVNDDR